MARNMSFAMTMDQFRMRTKTVTRRFGWWFLKPGDEVRGVEKTMGLLKGERVRSLGMVRIVSVRAEPLDSIIQEDVYREGFPEWTPAQFVQMMVEHYHIDPGATVNRIQFEYL